MIDWQAESLRLTLFREKPIGTVVPLWQTLTKEDPEKVDSQPRANIIVEQGNFIVGNLTHFSDPFRINWTLSPSEEQQNKTSGFPVLGSLLEIKKQFLQMMIDWINSDISLEINRIALGSVILFIANSKKASYEQLSYLLPSIKLDTDGSSDFFYQINRPVHSTVSTDLIINRLSKWGALRSIGVGLSFGDKPELLQNKGELFASRLELDINTSQYNRELIPKDQLVSLLQELSSITDQIATDGDQ